MLKTYPCYNGMEENETVVDYSRLKLTKVPQEVIVRGRVLEELYLDSNSIEILPKGVYINLPNLRILSASDNNLCKLSTFIGNLDCLEKLDVSKNCISGFPDTIGKCTQLTQVDGSVNPIAKLPDGLMSLSSLTHLVLNETFLECLPEDFGRLSGLKVLELRQNYLHTLPKSINNFKKLERLDIGDNKFLHLPVAIGYLTSLQELLADGNMIEEIPPVIGLLGKLAFLELSKNKLETLPPEIKALKSLTDLYLSVNELLELPDNIGSLSNLQTLKLDENDLIYLPFSIGRLQSLEELDVTTNNLEGLPCSIGQLTKLQVLTLDNNCIKSLPEELGNCNSLSLLSLHNNDLIAVPNTLGNLQNLQMINVSANMLTFLPLSFLGLKKLRALWLSENQSKPVVPLQKKYDEKKKEYVVSCHLLPQQSWEKDQTEDLDKEESDGTSNSSITEDKEDNIDGKESEVVRTSGSISQYFVRQSKKSDGAVEGQGTPWYEQEFIESAEDCDVFPDEEENGEEDLSEEGSYNLNERNIASAESYQSRHSFKEEQPSSLSELPSEMSSSIECSCADDQPIKMTSLESAGTDGGMPSFIKEPIASSSLLSSPPASSSLSLDTGAVGLSKGVGNHIDNNSLADAAADTSNDCVYGNTSASVSSPPVPDCTDEDNIQTDHRFALPASDDEKMRLRFNNKRHRNGNPLCQYEAFKPTRFNLYQDCNDLSWSTLAKDTQDASPMIKKKSVTSKDNPLIGARLARDESPPSRGGENQKYTTNPKYEEKIRVLQQQRLKERSRRRNNSARVEYCGDSKFSKVLDAAPPPPYADMYRDPSNPSLVLPHGPPPYYVISDEGDSVTIKLSDFVLTSPSTQNGKPVDRRRTNPADKHVAVAAASSRVKHGESSPPVGANRLNGFVEQQPSESHYLNNTGDRYPIEKDGRVLRTSGLPNGVSGSNINGRNVSSSGGMAEVAKGRRINGNYYKDDNIDRTGDIAQRDDRNQSNKSDHVFSRNDNGASFTAQLSEDVRRGREENSGNYQNSPRSQVQEPKIRTRSSQSGSEQKRVTLRSDCTTDSSSTARPRAVKKLLLPQDETVQHVTVKSRKINRPVSPRVIMAVDGRNGNQDVAFKEFSSSCRVEDVTSFLVNNISEVTPMVTDQDDIDDTRATGQIIHEQVPVDCDVEDVTRNISKHLVEFCKVQNVESGKADKLPEMKVQVTDLDMPDAACPLSRNVQNDENVKDKHKNFQVIPVPTGPKEEIEVRVYRSPILGFSIGGGMKTGTNMIEGVYVVAVNPDGPSSLLLKPGDRILEVNKLNLRSVSHEHAVLFLTHNQQLDLVIERVCQ